MLASMAMTDRPALHDNLSVDTSDVVGIVSGVRAVFDSGRTRPVAWRHAQLDGLLRLLKEETPRFEAALAADLGRSPLEAFAADIGATATEIAHIRKHVGTWAKPRKVRLPLNARPGSGHIVPEPLGGAHANREETFATVKSLLVKELDKLQKQDADKRINTRLRKFSNMGVVAG